MNENVSRKVTITVVLIVLSLVCLLQPKPFRLGLDLQGGTRLVYKFDFEEALRRGQVTSAELANKPALLQSFRDIIHDRIDPKGVLEISIRSQGEDQLVIELPGAADFSGQKIVWKIAAELPAQGGEWIELDPGPGADPNAAKADQTAAVETIKAFPLDGGLVQIGSEQITYSSRETNKLRIKERGASKTQVGPHAAGESIELMSSNELEDKITNVGDLQFLIEAKDNDPDLSRYGTDKTRETQKKDAWFAAHPNGQFDEFNRLAPEQGGPAPNLRWYPMRVEKGQIETAAKDRLRPLVAPSNPEWSFTGADLEKVEPSTDHLGYPAVSLEITSQKSHAFEAFSEAHINDSMGIVLNQEIATLARINSKLSKTFIIEGGAGGFTQKEVNTLVSILKSGSLRVKPELQDRARVGASLGQDYITTGAISMGVAVGVIILFMLFFYRRLGLYSVVGLLLNLLFLMGAMAFMRATLTLPGVAGIILTLGMAVDGNILIYERLREELQRGLKPIQACKASFERAGVTIIDSNLTTLIAGVILQYMGTGPIRGFAVTLNIGILSTLFTVIIVTELLVFLDLKRGKSNLSMISLFKTPNIAFMRTYKYFLGASWVFVIVGIGLFAWLPERDKLGIDFLGGLTMKVRTAQPMQIEDLRHRIGGIQGALGQSEVKEIRDSSVAGQGYTLFTITYKLAHDESGEGATQAGEKQIRDALADVLAPDPVVVSVTPGEANASVTGTIAFDEAHPTGDIAAALSSKGLDSVAVTAPAGADHVYAFTATADKTASADRVKSTVTSAFIGAKDSARTVYSLHSPIPESSLVGPQVGTELRNKAVLAVVLSLIGTMLYLRIRFAEVGYGVAVVVSLIHDVFMTLTWISIACATGLVQAEIDLAMVAAFLTIIGYSQNDTIVIFDRVRENRPKSKAPLEEVLNESINQTLARTILTTSTVVLTLVVLFAFNFGTRNVLEGFSFAMLVGVLSGAYSTVYIASPVLLWFEKWQARRGGPGAGATAGRTVHPKSDDGEVAPQLTTTGS